MARAGQRRQPSPRARPLQPRSRSTPPASSPGPVRRDRRRPQSDRRAQGLPRGADVRGVRRQLPRVPAWAAKAPTTQRSDQGRLDRYLLPALGRLRLTAITPEHVEALHRDLCRPGARPRPWRARAVPPRPRAAAGRVVHGRRCRLLRACWARGQAAADRHQPGSRARAGHGRRRTAIPDAGAYAQAVGALELLRAGGGTMARACDVVGLIALTGARKSEIRLLRWRHVDLEAREIRLPAGEHKTGRKTGAVRVIALSDAAIAILAGLRARPARRACVPGPAPGVAVDLARPWARIASGGRAAGDDHPAHAAPWRRRRPGRRRHVRDAGRDGVLGHARRGPASGTATSVDGARAVLAQRAAELVRPVKLRAVG